MPIAEKRKKYGHPQEKPSDKISFEYFDKLMEAGLTDEQISIIYSVDRRTITNWKNDPEFFSHLKNGKAIADEKVVRSLFERATGYSHPDTHISNYQGTITVTPIEKHYPPDVLACIFWLKNRMRDEWKDVHKVEHGGTIKVLEELTSEQIEQRIAQLLAESGINDGADKAIARLLCQAGVNTSK